MERWWRKPILSCRNCSKSAGRQRPESASPFCSVLTKRSEWMRNLLNSKLNFAATAGAVCLDKTIRILSVQPTIVAASRHSHDDVSGGGAKKLREGRGVFQGGF